MTKTRVNRVLLGSLLVIAGVLGGVLQLLSSTGALVNTAARLETEGWVVLGLLGFGFIGMVLYALAGPRDAQPIS